MELSEMKKVHVDIVNGGLCRINSNVEITSFNALERLMNDILALQKRDAEKNNKGEEINE